MKKTKRSGNYGKRYSPDQIHSVLAKWRKNLASATPVSKSSFCASMGFSQITLSTWLAKYSSTTDMPDTERASGVHEAKETPKPDQTVSVETVTIVDLQPVAAIPLEEDTVRIVQAIQIRQTEIARLKDQLIEMVKAL